LCQPRWPAAGARRNGVGAVKPRPAAIFPASRRAGELTFAVVSKDVHSTLLVSDDAIFAAQRLLWERLRIVAEPGGCPGLAELLSGGYSPGPTGQVAVVVSGANTTSVDLTC
jgi:threonine dehydratase